MKTPGVIEDDAEGGIDLSQLLVAFREKLWLIVLFLLLGLFAGLAYVKRMPRTFLSVAVVEVSPQTVKVVDFDAVTPMGTGVTEIAEAVVAGFRNRAFLQFVVQDSHLLKEPEFLPAPTGDASLDNEAAVNVLASLQDVQVRRGTPFIDVGAQHSSPRLAQKLADALANGYIRQAIRQRAAASEMAIEFLKNESVKLKSQLEDAEKALQNYVRTSKSMSLQEKQDTVISKFKSLNEQLLEAQTARLRLEADDEEIREVAGDSRAMLNIGSVASHPTIMAAKQQISSLETTASTLALRYTDKHPKMIETRLKLAEAESALAESLSRMPSLLHASYQNALATERKFQRALAEQEKLAMDLNEQGIKYNVLTRDVDTYRALYDAILKRMKEAEIAKGIEFSNLHIFEPATLPTVPVQPGKGKVLALSLGIGLAAGMGLAFGLTALDSSLRTVEQAEQTTRLSVVGAIPRGSSSDESNHALALHRNPASSVAEAFRSLRALVHLTDRGRSSHVILFTSANAAEGKTYCAINYAVAVAQQGLRVLLVDADLRVPMVEKLMLPDAPHCGLSDYLENTAGTSPTVHPTELDNLWVMPAGSPVNNPAEILSSGVVTQLMQSFRNVFHCIIIDTAPILPVSDTMLLVEHAETICLVARAGRTPRKEVLRAAQMLTNASGKTPSLIVNRLSTTRRLGRYSESYAAYRGTVYEAGGRRQSPALRAFSESDISPSLVPGE